ncbi:MAG: heme lyase CcmF/NrfE family subunit [Gammaproteobacteria bacterium]
MIPELGHFALILAFCMALVQGILPLIGAQRGRLAWMAVAFPAAWAQLLFVAIAFACLAYAFLAKDFSVAYVAEHSNSLLPAIYRFSAVWGAHEGSLLLWSLILAGWTVAVTLFSRSLPLEFASRVVGVMGLVSVGFLLFMLSTSNPFERLFPAPMDGRDLNPLLQDPGLVIHPPLLYMGYVGLAVPFSFAIATLLEGRLDAAWTRWTRPWTLVAWVFLTLGITLGSWWAYYELGWGGWWFWDPVENASFMPWLIATALIHCLAVTEKRNAFKGWSVLLAIFGFSLSLLGTFLVRSGVLVSVHAFATDPARGVFILAFLGLTVGSALLLYAWRVTSVTRRGGFELLSRESLLLTNNVLLTVACATILLGTLYPLLMDSLNLGKISVGPPYFNAVFIPLMMPLVFLLGLGPLTRWKRDRFKVLSSRLKMAFLISVLLAGLLAALTAVPRSITVALGLGLAVWVTYTALQAVAARFKYRRDFWRTLRTTPREFFGMTLAHLGVAVFVVGVTLTSTLTVEQDVRFELGGTHTLAGYEFRFEGVSETMGPNYRAQQGEIRVFRAGEWVTTLFPEKRFYPVQSEPMTEAAIDPGLTRDLYVVLGEPLGDGAWSGRLYYNSFVRWIWLGPLLMSIGGLLAASDRRYRLAKRARGAVAHDEAPTTEADALSLAREVAR